MRFFYTIKRVMSVNREEIPACYITMLFLTVNQGLVAYSNYIMGNLTDAITSASMSVFWHYILLLAVVQVFRLLAGYQVNYRVNYLSESFVRRLRSHTYRKITNACMRWLNENRLGDIISRINGDLNALVVQIQTFMTWQVVGLVTFLVCMAACFLIQFKLSLISFAMVPVLGFLQFMTGKPIAKLGERRSVAEGQANSVFMNLLGGLGVIRIFKAEKNLAAKYEKEVEKCVTANVKSFALEFLMYPLQMLMGYLPNIVILVVGSRMVLAGEMTLGMLFSYILLATAALDAVGSLSWQVRNIYNTIGIAGRIFEIWDVEEEKNEGTVCEKTDDVPIRAEHVSFAYNEETPVLKDVSFTVKKGEQVAIVGASGSGKSTIARLLTGFYEKDEGNIAVFGSPLESWDKDALRKHISYVGQESFLFPGSIYSNVALGSENADEEQVMACIRAVGLDGLDVHEEIGERGTLLSGGQKQRVSVARALLKNADILLMDEPTSALDTESEYFVQQAVEKLAKGKTAVTIAHRLSTICYADRILCMKGGQIAESGTHEELMQKKGIYCGLYERQEKVYEQA